MGGSPTPPPREGLRPFTLLKNIIAPKGPLAVTAAFQDHGR